MFTGLIEEMGRVAALQDSGGMACLKVQAKRVLDGTRVGDSISVNGVCLTVNELAEGTLVFYAMPETLRRTALRDLRQGSVVNLERAMSPEDRFGGHIVQGHVDGVGEVLGVETQGGAEIWEFGASEEVLRYMVEKGSICVDGISLTVVSVGDSSFTVSILPQTKEATALRALKVGSLVNLEADVIGKYVERLLGPQIARRSMQDAV